MGKKESIGKFVLLALEKAVDGYVRFEDFTYHHYRYHYDYPEIKKSALSKAIKRLREKGLIEKTTLKDENKIILKLTEAGREFLLISKEDNEIEWDGKWRIVVFDIPEKQRTIRNILRSRLKMWGFSPWQQSVWASKKNITKKLRNLVKELDITNWVLVIESDNVGNTK